MKHALFIVLFFLTILCTLNYLTAEYADTVMFKWFSGQQAFHGVIVFGILAVLFRPGPEDTRCIRIERPEATPRYQIIQYLAHYFVFDPDYLTKLPTKQLNFLFEQCRKPRDPCWSPARCRACNEFLTHQKERIADGCPCNSVHGINHGIVPEWQCTCVVCDPEQTGSARQPFDRAVAGD